jgi:hypothetical protein
MSHFYGDMTGSRGEATRCGTKSSGIRAHLRGWNIGCKVYVTHDKDRDLDVIEVWKTGGSNGVKPDKLLVRYTIV